jgi:hypothetical protein
MRLHGHGLALISFLGTACGGAPPALEPTEPVRPAVRTFDLDLSVAEDRARVEPRDLRFVEATGPYAVYEVTGPAPRLIGPNIITPTSPTWAMLCTASAFFAPRRDVRIRPELHLARESAPEDRWVSMPLAQAAVGACTNAKDAYGQRVHPSTDPNATPTASPDPSAPSSESSPPAMNPNESVMVEVSPAPPVGSRLLLLRVALDDERPGHNDSHSMPRVCCTESSCNTPTASGGGL